MRLEAAVGLLALAARRAIVAVALGHVVLGVADAVGRRGRRVAFRGVGHVPAGRAGGRRGVVDGGTRVRGAVAQVLRVELLLVAHGGKAPFPVEGRTGYRTDIVAHIL